MTTKKRLTEQLIRQLSFIERSCKYFDEGHLDEAIRIATTIRVLIHQTSKSNSLLKLLGVRSSIKLLSSIEQPNGPIDNIALFDGVTMFHSKKGTLPRLRFLTTRYVDVETWWNEIAVISGQNEIHKRKSIVLNAANKDGGAHIDELPKQYKELTHGLFTILKDNDIPTITMADGIPVIGNGEDITNHQFYAIRVFAQELLCSPEIRKLTL